MSKTMDAARASMRRRARRGAQMGQGDGTWIRLLWLLVARFVEQCHADADAPTLAAQLDRIIELSRLQWQFARHGVPLSPPQRAEQAACLGSLSASLRQLQCGERPGPSDLAHLLDPMIVWMIRLGPAAGKGGGKAARRRRPRAPRVRALSPALVAAGRGLRSARRAAAP